MTVRADGDDALLQAVADGDRQALEALYRRHAPWLVLRLSRRCADPGLVEEVVQDTFVAVWRGAGRYRGSGEVPAWIWGIGIRRLIDRLRRKPALARGRGRPTVRRGVGMRSMAERVESLGGTFVMRSSVGHGTVVSARLPLDRP